MVAMGSQSTRNSKKLGRYPRKVGQPDPFEMTKTRLILTKILKILNFETSKTKGKSAKNIKDHSKQTNR